MKAKRRVKAEGWAELLTREKPDGVDAFDLVCAHGAARSENVTAIFSWDTILGLALFYRGTMPADVSHYVIEICVIRTVLARLLHAETGCSCGGQPFEVVEPDPEDGGGS